MSLRRSLVLPLLVVAAPVLAAQAPRKPVRLVVALVVDQMRPDYFDRFGAQFTGGLGALLRQGVFYRYAEQDHAITETAPGHSTMMTGRSPGSVGIVTNDLGVPDPLSPLLKGTATGASPRRFIGTTLFDWMLARDSATRVLSVSRKDRGAILPIGRAKVPVFWYTKGSFTTSRWYGDSLPAWVTAWNARDPIEQLKGWVWNLDRDSSAYSEVDDRPYEVGGADRVFPHRLSSNRDTASSEIEKRPIMDSLTLDFAWTGVKQLGLGRRDGTDFLSVSLSTNDAIGHRWGPGSRELHDHLLRLDRYLGAFFDSLATIVPPDQMIVTLTADHGVQDYPEGRATGTDGGRVRPPAATRELGRALRARWRVDFATGFEEGLLFADVVAMRRRGVNVDSIADALAKSLAATPGVLRVYTPRTLAATRRTDLDAMRWKRQIPADFGWLVAASLKPGYQWGSGYNDVAHGTTNIEDVRVPLIFRVPGVAGQRVERVARTIDLAPTLAAILGIRPLEPVEGAVLPEPLGRHPTTRSPR